MMVGWEACHHFLVNFLGVEDDDEPPGLSLFLGFFPQMVVVAIAIVGEIQAFLFLFWIDYCLRI
jgi:hypothetical protein